LLSVVSAARPKIADYHFTTLNPHLGVVSIDDESSFVLADIPGIIEGAADGLGLGHDFLRHVERCRLLLHVIDVSGCEGRDPLDDFEKINAELERFSAYLAQCPQIVVGNKIDSATEEQMQTVSDYMKKHGYPYYEISAAAHFNTKELMYHVYEAVSALPPIKYYETEYHEEPDQIMKNDRSVRITKQDHLYLVEGDWLVRIMRGINFDEYESLQYFQRILNSAGVIQRLRDEGIQEGDTVDIYGFEFDFVN
jgi:GTP-binding protein